MLKLITAGGHRWRAIPHLDARSESNGSFVIEKVPAGSYQTVVYTSKSTQIVSPRFEMPANSDFEGLSIDIGSALEGHVAGQINDTGGQPIARVEVVAYSGTVIGVANSDSDGRFRIGGLGSVKTVTISAKGFRTGHDRDRRRGVAVGSDDVDFVLQFNRKVEGQIVDLGTGQPVRDFEVRWDQRAWVRCHSDLGTFELTDIKRNVVAITARAPGYSARRLDSVVLEAGETTEDLVIGLSPGFECAGRTIDATTGKPLAGVRIKLFSGELRHEFLAREYGWGEFDPVTDREGRFVLGGLPVGGRVGMVAWRRGYAPSVRLDVGVSAGSELLFELRVGARLTGTATRDGQPASGHVVVCFRLGQEDGLRYHCVGRISTDSSFEIEHLPPGNYRVDCYELSSEQALWSRDLEIAESGVRRIQIEIDGR